ncbi:hypothetical protein J6590_035945 [Homalodisca vitripennis]|nr:hypothetical protein J6590_035945 [Homalodisca vitripennis]
MEVRSPMQFMVNENRGTNFTSDDNAEVEKLTEQLLDEEAVDNPDEQVVGEFDGLLRQNEADMGEDITTNEPTNVPLVKPPSSTNKPTHSPLEKPLSPTNKPTNAPSEKTTIGKETQDNEKMRNRQFNC